MLHVKTVGAVLVMTLLVHPLSEETKQYQFFDEYDMAHIRSACRLISFVLNIGFITIASSKYILPMIVRDMVIFWHVTCAQHTDHRRNHMP